MTVDRIKLDLQRPARAALPGRRRRSLVHSAVQGVVGAAVAPARALDPGGRRTTRAIRRLGLLAPPPPARAGEPLERGHFRVDISDIDAQGWLFFAVAPRRRSERPLIAFWIACDQQTIYRGHVAMLHWQGDSLHPGDRAALRRAALVCRDELFANGAAELSRLPLEWHRCTA